MSKIGDKIYVGTDVYVACEDICGDCCGCVADYQDALCNEITRRVGCLGIIWIKQQPIETQATTCNQTKGEPEMNTANEPVEVTAEEPKYTLADFIEACEYWYGTDDCDPYGRNKYFKKFLERKNNPEYQEFLKIEKQYLDLKRKFS